ncbi:hypothetical protein CY34DRAFT_806072 [Suillus luteus UH-Slu-Lm8-n1]|uniref:Unplaced genomic scaffold CY34scaffold_138, whole genome shotgun sequence n=1 Tax=Suillus luteus UH-Slu-Lm8-n1 TaxID=930992 RepID=A0A0D0B4L4_9AGAM|nr:hypothetical protein CY34DRAFT_806072 [Suillus luteus UH-Slu-Lm8-n1]
MKGRERWGGEHGEKRSAAKSTTGEICVRHVTVPGSIENGLVLQPTNRESQISQTRSKFLTGMWESWASAWLWTRSGLSVNVLA